MRMHYSPGLSRRRDNTIAGLIGLVGLIYMVITGWIAYGPISIVFDVLFVLGLAAITKNTKTH